MKAQRESRSAQHTNLTEETRHGPVSAVIHPPKVNESDCSARVSPKKEEKSHLHGSLSIHHSEGAGRWGESLSFA